MLELPKELPKATAEGYKQTRRFLRALRTLNTNKAERQTIGEMISDCDYALEWLQTGRRPGSRRGIERRAAYQRERPIDPIRLQAFAGKNKAGSPANLSDGELFQIECALNELSPLERECFELAFAQCYPHSEIASMLSISKGNVSTILHRAEEKIKKIKSESLFFAN